MCKYSYELKKRIVDEYNQGHGGYGYLAKRYGVSDKKVIRRWVANYNKFGEDGIKRSRKRIEYSYEFKVEMVKSYLSSEISYQELALNNGMNNSGLIAIWVSKYRSGGLEALRPRKKGRKSKLKKSSNYREPEGSFDTSAERIKELEEELYRSRLEIDFLKEMRRLRLEDEAKMRERLASSTVSEDNIN